MTALEFREVSSISRSRGFRTITSKKPYWLAKRVVLELLYPQLGAAAVPLNLRRWRESIPTGLRQLGLIFLKRSESGRLNWPEILEWALRRELTTRLAARLVAGIVIEL